MTPLVTFDCRGRNILVVAALATCPLPCRAWSDDRRSASSAAEPRIGWVLGFLTACSRYGATSATDVSRGKGIDELAVRIDRYRDEHSSEPIHKAASAPAEVSREAAKPWRRGAPIGTPHAGGSRL